MDGIVLLFSFLSELSLQKLSKFLILYLSFYIPRNLIMQVCGLEDLGTLVSPLNGSTLKLLLINFCNSCLCLTLLGNCLLVALLFLFLPFPFWMHAFYFIKFGRVLSSSFLHNFVMKNIHNKSVLTVNETTSNDGAFGRCVLRGLGEDHLES